MKISIVIPNFNGGEFLGECLDSVIAQDLPEKEIIVMDGGSNDLSRKIIREYEEHIAHWESAPDGGPYHAVEKGLNLASGDVLCWINSDDIFLPGALREAAEIFSGDPGIQWLSGLHATFLEMSVLRAKEYPTEDFFISDDNRYAVQLFRTTDNVDWSLDYILEEAPRGGYFLQQESTFWRRDLWESVGGFDHRYRLAGDYWLWLQFLERAQLTLVDRPFGCFRQTPEQRSEQQGDQYKREALAIAAETPCGERFPVPGDEPESSPETDPETDLPRSPIQVRHLVKERLCLATSIAPRDVQKQAYCITTWQLQGCRVLSFNTPEEIDEIRNSGHKNIRDVEFIPVQDTARDVTGKDQVLLRDIIAHYQQEDPDRILGIINSDILIEPHIDLLSFARSACAEDGCLISSRIDLEDFWDREGQVFMGGYDAFFFRSPHIRDYPMETEFAIGAPWWDYFFPHFLRQSVKTVHYPRPIPFYHKQHTTNYPTSTWVHYGQHFLSYFDPELLRELDKMPGIGYRLEFLARVARQFTVHFYRNCEPLSPVEWATLPPYGNGFHSRMEKLQGRIRQWADRAILAEELLQSR